MTLEVIPEDYLTHTCEEERDDEVVKARMMKGSMEGRTSDEIVP